MEWAEGLVDQCIMPYRYVCPTSRAELPTNTLDSIDDAYGRRPPRGRAPVSTRASTGKRTVQPTSSQTHQRARNSTNTPPTSTFRSQPLTSATLTSNGRNIGRPGRDSAHPARKTPLQRVRGAVKTWAADEQGSENARYHLIRYVCAARGAPDTHPHSLHSNDDIDIDGCRRSHYREHIGRPSQHDGIRAHPGQSTALASPSSSAPPHTP
jgi:hypothetical protein